MAQKRFKGADNRHAARGRGEAQSGARHEAGSVQPILVDHANFRSWPIVLQKSAGGNFRGVEGRFLFSRMV
jgi:hypothetical protein